MPLPKVNEVRYNAQLRSYEARVDISADGKTASYPCRLRGPMTMDPALVLSGLARQAQRLSTSGRGVRLIH